MPGLRKAIPPIIELVRITSGIKGRKKSPLLSVEQKFFPHSGEFIQGLFP